MAKALTKRIAPGEYAGHLDGYDIKIDHMSVAWQRKPEQHDWSATLSDTKGSIGVGTFRSLGAAEQYTRDLISDLTSNPPKADLNNWLGYDLAGGDIRKEEK